MASVISIIIPAYNCESTIERAVESARSQVIRDVLLEIVVVNDGSTDGTAEVLGRVSRIDKRVKVVCKENGGVSSARNAGIENSRGEFFSFLDADDVLCDGYLEHLYSNMKACGADLSVIGYSKGSNNDVNHRSSSRASSLSFFAQIDAMRSFLLEDRIDPSVCTKLFKRNVCGSLRFDEELAMSEDRKFIFQYLMACDTVVFDPLPLYCYIVRDDSAMTSSFNEGVLGALSYCEYATVVGSERYPSLGPYFSCQELRTKCRALLRIAHDETIAPAYIKLSKTLREDIRRYSYFDAFCMLPNRHFAMCLLARISPKINAIGSRCRRAI